MYYATYNVGQEVDIAAFETKQERDDWVNFQDPFSKDTNTTKENCTFERIILNEKEAVERIEFMPHRIDEINPKIHWYIEEFFFGIH